MLRYDTNLPYAPPVSEKGMTDALQGLRVQSPYKKFGSAHQDTLGWMGDNNAATYQQAAQRANLDYGMKQQEAERGLALAGLQQMAQAQQNAQSLSNSRLQNMTGIVGDSLRNLYR